MPRKTIEVQTVKTKINDLLSKTSLDQVEKRVLCSFLEGVLLETSNYHGFNYVYWEKKGYHEWLDSGRPEDSRKNQFIVGDMGEWSRIYY